jgi:hypothetical protein
MANVKISDLTDGDPIAAGDLVEIERPGAPAVSRKATLGTAAASAATAFQPLDADLTAVAALATTTAGRSALTIADPGADRVVAWDDTAGAMAAIALADINAEAAPAAGDFVLAYTAEGALVKVDWDDLPSATGSGAFSGDPFEFTGDGIVTAFDLATEVAGLTEIPAGSMILWIEDGIPQHQGVHFTVAGTVVTRNTAPVSGAVIEGWLARGVVSDFLNLAFTIDGGGAVIATGLVPGHVLIPAGFEIVEWTLLADQTGSIVVDIWKDTYANYPPTVADTITAAAKPTISTAVKGQSSTLTSWTTTLAADDVLLFNVDSVTSIQSVTLFLKLERA